MGNVEVVPRFRGQTPREHPGEILTASYHLRKKSGFAHHKTFVAQLWLYGYFISI